MLNINLPLYNYITKTFGAYWQPHQEQVELNLNNSCEDNQWYLGTYFPRSFKESYTIFNDIYTALQEYGFCNYNTLNILDIGSGTGGQIFGLLQSIEENITSPLNINIYSVDGNHDSIDIQGNIFSNYWSKHTKNKLDITFYEYIFKNSDDITSFIKNNLLDKGIRFDIVLTFKALSEILQYDKYVYQKTLMIVEKVLKEDGFFILSDVTMKIKTAGYNYKHYIPFTVNKNVSKYVEKLINGLNIVVPLCCFNNKLTCNRENCYTQCKIYSLMYTDTGIRQVECKIDYKLFIKNGKLYDNLYISLLKNLINTCSYGCLFKKNKNLSKCYCSEYGIFKDYFNINNFDSTQFSLVKLKKIYDGQSENETYSGDIVISDDDVPY